MAIREIRNALRRMRHEQSVGQQELALRAGISRQALSEIEAGRSCPSTAIALQLGKVLRCRVEDLFHLDEESGALVARWAGSGEVAMPSHREEGRHGRRAERAKRRTGNFSRVALGWVNGQWVAHPLAAKHPASLCIAADGLVQARQEMRRPRGQDGSGTVQVRLLRGRAALRGNILVLGCDPALGLLSAWLNERRPDARVIWLHAPSMAALEVLAQGGAHLAGTHLLDEQSRDFNVPFVRALFPHRSTVVINLARWEEGFVLRSGNPLRIRKVEDLARAQVRWINREPGSGARRLLDRLLAKARVSHNRVNGYQRVAAGHLAVAHAVSMDAADAGIATRAAALANGLDFIPLTEERSDLVVPQELCGDPRIGRMVDALESRAFRRELASLDGYQVAQSGHLVEEVRAG